MYFVKASALVFELTILCQHQILRNKKNKYREVIQIRAVLWVKKSAGYGLLSESDK